MCRWVEVVVLGIIILLTTSYWDLPCPAPGGEWENYSYQRIKRVCSQVYLLPGVQVGGGEDGLLHGGDLESGGAAYLCQ